MAKARIEVLGDSSSYQRAIKEAAVVTDKLGLDMKKLSQTATSTAHAQKAAAASTTGALKRQGITAEASAKAQVAASVHKTQRLKDEAAQYRKLASEQVKDSREQRAATNLAIRSEKQLAGSLAATKHETRAFGASAARGERDLGRMTRGALAGSGVFRSLGRSIAFAGGGFLAFAGVTGFLRQSVTAAREAATTQGQLSAQLKASGVNLADYSTQIDKTNLRLSALSGFTKDELDQSFTTIFRTTDNVSKALRDNATAADLARAKHIGLSKAALIIANVEAGNTTLLRRQGFQIAKNLKPEEALAILRAKIAGQARAGTTEEQRFSAILHDTQVIIGTALLPTLNKYLGSLGQWLTKMNESGRLQKDVNTAVKDGKQVIDAVAGSIHAADRVTGSFKHTLELLLALKVASKLAHWRREMILFQVAAGAGGAGGAGGRIAKLGAGLRRLAQIGLVSLAFRFPRLAEGLSKIPLLRGQLTKLALIRGITIPVIVAITAEWFGHKIGENLDFSPKKFLDSVKHPLRDWKGPLTNWILGKGWKDDVARAKEEAARKLRTALAGTLNVTATSEQNPRINVPGSPTFVSPAAKTKAQAGSNLTPAQKNTFFDNQIARILLRGGLGTISQQIAALQRANTLIAARLKVTKDVTRKLNLEDQLLQNAAQIKSLSTQARQEAGQKVIDALQFGVTKAQATASSSDDIAALQALQAGVRRQIGVQGKTLELEQQLFDVGQQIVQARQAAFDSLLGGLNLNLEKAQATAKFGDDIKALQKINAALRREIAVSGSTVDLQRQLFENSQQLKDARRQQTAAREFRILGLGPTGDALTPTRRNLRKRLGQLTANVRSSDLDSPKLEAELKHFRETLANKLVPPEVRTKVREMMDQIAEELKNSGQRNQTKFKHLANNAILAGLGLSPDQTRLLVERLGQMSAGGVVPGAPSLAFAHAGAQTVVHTTVMLDGKVVAKNTTAHQQKADKRRSVGRRGPYAGRR